MVKEEEIKENWKKITGQLEEALGELAPAVKNIY